MSIRNKSGFRLEYWIVLLLSVSVFVDGVEEAGEDGNTYDFIVVGGGTGGCAVAARLAENGKHTVLLIEEGGVPEEDQDIPALQGRYMGNPNAVKVHEIVPQVNAGQATNGSLRLIVGRGLGGGSSINGMFYNRGNPHDYNYWFRYTRDESWNYTNLLHYFRKVENYLGEYPSEEHGYDGPIAISRPQYAPGMSEWLQAGRELGYPNLDPNGPQKLTFTTVEYAKKFGRRVSSYTGYIKPLLQKSVKNLKVLTHSEVTKIIFAGTRAVGVNYRTSANGATAVANARNEIVISAGVIGTPVLLMKSGIGPRSVLSAAGIKIVRNLSVGKYIHDHVGIQVPVIVNNRSAVFDPEVDLDDGAWMIFNQFGDGPYSSSLGTAGQAFVPSSIIPPSEKLRNWADLQLIASNIPQIGPPRPAHELKELRAGETYATWVAIVSRPKSRGSVSLNSSNPDGPPIIDFNYLNHPLDMRVAIDGAKWIARICEETTTYRSLGCRMPPALPACRRYKFGSDKYWRCYVRHVGRSWLHPVGSCVMGRGADNLQATVDTELKVIGIDGLRIADASIMPSITNAQTAAAVYVIAEKASDMILTEWETSPDSAPGARAAGKGSIPPRVITNLPVGKVRKSKSRYMARIKVTKS